MKKSNGYAELIDPALYERMPKTVLAALVVSLMGMVQGEEILNDPQRLNTEIMNEWKLLNLNGIVPQKPGAALYAKICKCPFAAEKLKLIRMK